MLVDDVRGLSFVECHEDHAAGDESRGLRCISWSHDPDPSDGTHTDDFAFLLREDGEVRAVHDRHICGLFLLRRPDS